MKCFSLVILFCAQLSLTSCGASKASQKKSGQENEDLSGYKLEYSDVMEFTRGVAGSFQIVGSFIDEKPARISIDGLPDGANFENDTLSWTPSCELKPENGQFLRGYILHRLRISLISTVSDSLVQKPAIIVVHKDGEQSPCP